MLRIAICDDSPQHRVKIHQIVERSLFSRTEMKISYYENGSQVIQDIEHQNFHADLLLLDIHMDRKNGIETADYIRRNQVDVDIIFVTVSADHVFQGYTYKAFAYVLKPLDERRLTNELNRYMDEKELTEDFLNIPVRGMIQRIPIRRIVYFESDSRKIIVHMQDDVVEFYAKLDDVQEVVGTQNFVRCHQSYLVNRRYISSVGRNELLAENIMLPISRKYQKEMKVFWE